MKIVANHTGHRGEKWLIAFFIAQLQQRATESGAEGVAGVAQVRNLQDILLHIGYGGHRHRVRITPGRIQTPLRQAPAHYLDFEATLPQDRV